MVTLIVITTRTKSLLSLQGLEGVDLLPPSRQGAQTHETVTRSTGVLVLGNLQSSLISVVSTDQRYHGKQNSLNPWLRWYPLSTTKTSSSRPLP